MNKPVLAALCLILASQAGGAEAHVFAPALLEIREIGPERLAVRWKQPQIRQMGSVLEPMLPEGCHSDTPETRIEGTGITSEWFADCPSSLVGRTIEVRGIAGSGANVLLRVILLDGRTLRQVLKPEAPSFTVPERQSSFSVAADYTTLGVEHILTGWDHLLFVLGLVLLVGWGSKLFWTITAFTLGHSVTLALAVLGVVNVPQALIEALIAASIYFLAVELVRKKPGHLTLIERMPWLIASAFGLLHGLGFAGALTEVGLPADEIPLALFSFNVGIELGQLAFVAAVLIAWVALRALPVRWPRWATLAPAYGIGSLGAYWFFERLSGIPTPL